MLPLGAQDAADALSKCELKQIDRFERLLERFHAAGGSSIRVTDGDYPITLLNTLGRNAPPVLSVIGNLDLLMREHAGIVGARDASSESCEYAESCAKHFVRREIGVVSGAARGIDDVGHRACLSAGGSSVFVLPMGVLRYKGDEAVREALEDGRAAVISEFAPDAAWVSHAAITRNRTIAAMSRVLCVFEPRSTGGSIRTAEAGLAQGTSVLIHCCRGNLRVERRLLAAGAQRLPIEDGRALRRTLDQAWKNAVRPRGTDQQELFDGPVG